MVQILFTVFEMGHMYENAKVIHSHATLFFYCTRLYDQDRLCPSVALNTEGVRLSAAYGGTRIAA